MYAPAPKLNTVQGYGGTFGVPAELHIKKSGLNDAREMSLYAYGMTSYEMQRVSLKILEHD